MKPLIRGRAYVLGDNIDTDQIIPAEHLVYSLIEPEERKLYGRYALSGVPEDQQGLPEGGQPFTPPDQYRSEYTIIVGGKNFGCGSSREHAPWALLGFGFRVVVSTSFADIFRNNALKNGLLPVAIARDAHEQLLAQVQADPQATVTIDLLSQTLTLPDGQAAGFPIDSFSKTCLLQGVDQLGYLLSQLPKIEVYEQRREPVS